MATERSAAVQASSGIDATGGGADEEPRPVPRAPLAAADMLEYMSDMLIELRSIAEQNDWRTLSGLLSLAHAEAAIRRDEVSSRGRREQKA